MRLTRLLAAGVVTLAVGLGIAPMASAGTFTPQCDTMVVDSSGDNVFDDQLIGIAATALDVASDSDADVFVRGAILDEDITSSVYRDKFLDVCNPATDYILIIVDDDVTGVFYGPHFNRLTPLFDQKISNYLHDYYATAGDKTGPVQGLLNELRVALELNPEHANYVLHEHSYIANGYISITTQSDQGMTSFAKTLMYTIGGLLIALVFAIVMMLRDKVDHRWD